MRVLLSLVAFFFLFFILSSCGNRPNFMKYEVVFYAPLGTNVNEVGSNLPLLASAFSNQDTIFGDYIDVPTSFQIFRNKIYIADKYNRRISCFPLSTSEPSNTIIPATGEGYNFGTPFLVLLNKYGEIFVMASISNALPKFSLISNEDEPVFIRQNTNNSQYYIYKFSADGKFIFSLGENGIHTEPMTCPDRIDQDLFNNIYAYYKDYDLDREEWLVKRYSPSGELSFEFNSKYVTMTNTIGDKTYIGHIGDIYNLRNDERLLIHSQNYIISRKDKPVETPDEIYNSLDIYSVLQNAITKNIFRSKKLMDQFIAVTKDDVVVLYSYDERFKGIRFRFIDIGSGNTKEEDFYAPVIPEHYTHVCFYVDENGDIYSLVIKDDAYYVLLRWKKVKSRSVS